MNKQKCKCGHSKQDHYMNGEESFCYGNYKSCECEKFEAISQEIDVVGKPMIPSAPKVSGNTASVTPDTLNHFWCDKCKMDLKLHICPNYKDFL